MQAEAVWEAVGCLGQGTPAAVSLPPPARGRLPFC